MVDDQIIDLPVSEFLTDIIHILSSEIRLGSIYQRRFSVEYQI